MADLTQTPGDVQLRGIGTVYEAGTLAETVAQGQPVYFDATSNGYKQASGNSEDESKAKGVTLTKGDNGDQVLIVTSGGMDIGAALTEGEWYGVSDTSGAIRPIGELGSGKWETLLGVAVASDHLDVHVIHAPIDSS